MIRDFISDDKDGLTKLAADFYGSDAFESDVPVNSFTDCFDEIINGSPYLRGLTIMHKGEFLGYCIVSLTYSAEAGGFAVIIDELYVKPEFQALGVGKQVFDLIEEEYKDKAKKYYINCSKKNVYAVKLFEKVGYKETGKAQFIKEGV